MPTAPSKTWLSACTLGNVGTPKRGMHSKSDCGNPRPAGNQGPPALVFRVLQEMVAAQVAASQGELAAQQAEATAALQQLCAATASAQAATADAQATTAAGLEAHVTQQQQAAAGTAEQAAGLTSQVDALAAGLAAQQGSIQAALQQLDGVQADRLQGQAGPLEPMQGALKQLDALQTQVKTPRSALKPCSLAHSCNTAYRPGVSVHIIHSKAPMQGSQQQLVGLQAQARDAWMWGKSTLWMHSPRAMSSKGFCVLKHIARQPRVQGALQCLKRQQTPVSLRHEVMLP